MLQTIIVLPDGTEVSTGASKAITIKSYKRTASVNDDTELSIGSTCANALEATLYDIGAKLTLTAGDEVTVYRESDSARKKVGIFILDKPTRPSANTMKLTGYDRIIKLDKDLTTWVSGLNGWPYTLKAFAKMVCNQCGLTFVESTVPNEDFPVYQFVESGVTGRKIMKWLGEICARFCRATPDGKIEFAWYKSSGVTISPTGDRFFFQGALSYEEYQVEKIQAVQLRLADSESGAVWPEKAEGLNSYIITNNPIWLARVTENLLPYLEVVETELANITYTPCKAAIIACQDVEPGSIVDIVDTNGSKISTYVMSKVTTGQKDTIECTGSARRDGSGNVNHLTSAELMARMKAYSNTVANTAAQNAVDMQTQKDIFNKLTNNGELQGLFYQDGKWYVNFEYVQTLGLVADLIEAGTLLGMLIKAGRIESVDGKIVIDLENGAEPIFNSGISTNGLTVRADNINLPDLFKVLTEVYGTKTYAKAYLNSAAGELLFMLTEVFGTDFSPIGSKMTLSNQDATGVVEMQAIQNGSSIKMHSKGADADVENMLRVAVSNSLISIDLHTALNSIAGYFRLDGTKSKLMTDVINGKTVEWKDNGDGTFTLIGKEG